MVRAAAMRFGSAPNRGGVATPLRPSTMLSLLEIRVLHFRRMRCVATPLNGDLQVFKSDAVFP